MTSFGSAFVSISREKVIRMLNEVFSGISGLKGVHCCGNTDWSVLLATGLNILNFDAYNYRSVAQPLPRRGKKVSGQGVGRLPGGLSLISRRRWVRKR